MSDGPPRVPIALLFAGVPGAPTAPTTPPLLPAEAGAALRAFFEAHPTVAHVDFEIALNESGDDLEYAAGTLHQEGGAHVAGREGQRAGEALRRLLRADPHLAALPVTLVVAMEGIEHTFRITREATGAPPPAGVPADPDERAALRERARLAEREARFEGRDFVRDDDHVA
jgi:hypothetical protein